MSKKIAQLTKVIYHLNNKNEDHTYDLHELSEQYESEIETVRTKITRPSRIVAYTQPQRLCCCALPALGVR